MNHFVISASPKRRANPRRETISDRMKEIGIVDFSIIDAPNMDTSLVFNARRNFQGLSTAELCCTHGHKMALEAIIRNDLNSGIIFEDDFLPVDICPGYLPEDFDYVCLHDFLEFTGRDLYENNDKFIRIAHAPQCSVGYAVSNRFAEQIIRQLHPIYLPIDIVVKRLTESRQFNCYRTKRPVVTHSTGDNEKFQPIANS